MTKTRWIPDVRSLATAIAGSLALGALLGLPLGPQTLGRMAVTFPLVLFGVAITCAPALLIGGSLTDSGFKLDSAVRALGAGLQATGYALLGFVPVALFLACTGETGVRGVMPTFGLIATAVLLGLVRVWGALGVAREARSRMIPLFLGWSVVSLGIGTILLARAIEGGLS